MESTDLIPLSGDIAKTTRRAEEFRDLHEALQKNLQTYLPLTMDALSGVHQRVKSSMVADATKQMVITPMNNFDFDLTDFCLFVCFFDKDVGYYSKKIKVVDGVCWYIEISYVAGCLFVPCEVGCGDCALKSAVFS